MNQFIFANNIKTTVGLLFPSSSTTLTLVSSVNLPTLGAGQVMPITLNDAADGQVYEICYVTAISGTSLTVVRAREGTTAQNWQVGDFAFAGPTAQSVAATNGNPANPFLVATATTGDEAVNLDQLATYAPIDSPGFTGTPTAPTPSTGDNSTKIATTAFVKNQNYVTSTTAPVTSVAGKTGAVILDYTDISGAAPLNSPVFIGTPSAPSPSLGDNSNNLATTFFVKQQNYAPLASPALTGNPTAPTQSPGDNSTKLANTAYVDAAVSGGFPKAIAVGYVTISPTDDGTNTFGSAVVSNTAYAGVDLTNTAKYVLQSMPLGTGHLPSHAPNQTAYACDITSTDFTVSQLINDSTSTTSPGTWTFPWVVWQITP